MLREIRGLFYVMRCLKRVNTPKTYTYWVVLIPCLIFIVYGKCGVQWCQIRAGSHGVPSHEVPSMTWIPTWQHFLRVRLGSKLSCELGLALFCERKISIRNLTIEDMLLPRD
jgi:hypothetical protein